MKVVFNRFIPFKGFMSLAFCGIIFVREEYRYLEGTPQWDRMVNHESIHFAQQRELFFFLFYVIYLLDWLLKVILPPWDKAYRDISFEREAYGHQSDMDYLKTRKHFAQWRNK